MRLWETALNDVTASGRVHAPDVILTAPRGVGKTATVLKFEDLSVRQGYEVISVQAARGNATLIDSLLEQAERHLDTGAGPWQRSKRALERLGGVTFSAAGFGAGITMQKVDDNRRPPNPESLAAALAALATEVRADRPTGGVLLTVDEIQASASSDLTLLAAALQGLNKHHPDARVMFAASGLPNTEDALSAAGVTHPDRLFDVYPVELLLHPADARYAIVGAAQDQQVTWHPEATDIIVDVSSGYPAHLQVFADETWRAAAGPRVITRADAEAGVQHGAARLERRTLAPRFDRMSDRQREFVTALAVLGGRASMADLAVTLSRPRGSLSEFRDALLTEGDVYSPRRGEIALTAPVFAPYLRANYEQSRRLTSTRLLPLEEMQRNVEALVNVRRTRGIQEPLSSATLRSRSPTQLDGAPAPTPRLGEHQSDSHRRRGR